MRRALTSAFVIAVLWAWWEGYKWLWQTTHWTWPFAVDDTSMPHLHDIVAAFWQPTTTGGPPLIPGARADGEPCPPRTPPRMAGERPSAPRRTAGRAPAPRSWMSG